MPPKKPVSGLTRTYLFLYNLLSLSLWATCTLRAAVLLSQQLSDESINGFDALPSIFTQVFPLLLITQSLAGLEILHSLVGLVRAPLLTTTMQVTSRFVVVWGVMFLFREGAVDLSGLLGPAVGAKHQQQPVGVAEGDGLVGLVGETQYCDFAFLGCMFAWGVTECIRYGFFAMQLGGVSVPTWWQWLRYNTFFVLYPIGIASECVFMYFSLGHAEKYVHVYYKWVMMGIMAIYVPGSYILYTHMMSQRRRVMRGKSRVD
ncbi:hypothetical protein UA08_08947 [Talaromyces atroroseus]|uniref:Very-long-chain (3R)-3-hydroxyacyl-CoA dehydratase n=1 Tax=Talaromyces atroroseus TaxID=1441469 RepID=A0A225AAZ1_TALAT|nr:hypothetical protein UA08_08947 [Talaromyces atroroseus]OKL55893.1 hypothetical protein UA08_08947 [Talaromyces atroroseus]